MWIVASAAGWSGGMGCAIYKIIQTLRRTSLRSWIVCSNMALQRPHPIIWIQLMTFRSSTAERMAKMLKDIGEAYYRWHPTGNDASRDALIQWMHALLEQVGLGNRIAIVQSGDRYDMQRHNSKEKGVEVVDVYGWAVLRDNGKVYSKASVSVH